MGELQDPITPSHIFSSLKNLYPSFSNTYRNYFIPQPNKYGGKNNFNPWKTPSFKTVFPPLTWPFNRNSFVEKKMFNNTAIDVFIGLISIYLLYSLLATILMEAIAKLMGLRARNTLKAISKLLDDSPFTEKTSLSRYFCCDEFENKIDLFKNRPFTHLFYAHPSIKNLGSNNFSRKPSDISAELFSETLIQLLRGDGFKGEENQLQTIEKNIQLGKLASAILPLPKFYQYESLAKSIIQKKTNSIAIHPLTTYQLQQFILESHSDIAQFKARIILWYNQMMERATGWYIKQTRIILFLIGFILAISFNINTISISQKLSSDVAARSFMIQFAEDLSNQQDYGKKSPELNEKLLKDLEKTGTILSASDRCTNYSFLGYFITGCAISLGASFWFDLLKKIMSIRQAGKTYEKSADASVISPEDIKKIIG